MEPVRLTENARVQHSMLHGIHRDVFKAFIDLINKWRLMRNIECWTRLFAIAGAIFFIGAPLFVFAYAPETTHKGLTDEAIDFFNATYFDFALSAEEKELVKKGSVDEDENTQLRWMRHFYDPVYKLGLTLETANGIVADRWESSKSWAQNTEAQAAIDPQNQTLLGAAYRYFDAETDYSWERAIYDYTWSDKRRGLEALGHVLHLIQDATVPDHTRNDPHPPYFEMGSPYEAWTDRFNEDNMRIAEELRSEKKTPALLPSLNQYFEEVASYSNNNFFSKDTVPDKNIQYKSPTLGSTKIESLKNGDLVQFVYDSTENYRLVLLKVDILNNKVIYFIEDEDRKILTDYWSRLSKQAVLHGAGVIKLFFDEVARERQSKKLLAKQEQSGGILARIIDGLALRSLGEAGKRTIATLAGLFGNGQSSVLNNVQPLVFDKEKAAKESEGSEENTTQMQSLQTQLFTLQDYLDYFRGSIEKRRSLNTQRTLSNSALFDDVYEQALRIQRDLGSIQAQLIDVLAPRSHGEVELTPQSSDQNRSEEGFIRDDSAQEAADDIENVRPLVSDKWHNISQGGAGGQSPPSSEGTAPPSPPPDTTPPNFSFSIKECDNNSFALDGCVLAPQELNLSWNSTASDLDDYMITCSVDGGSCASFIASPTAATSTIYVAADQKIYTFQGLAKDKTGNTSTTTTITVEIWSAPVVINEIAWRGTSASNAFDEWIELKNNTSKAINLSNFILYSETDEGPYLAFSEAANKTISANGHYLIERTDDMTISTIVGDFVTPFGNGLNNSQGETLSLVKIFGGATTTTIDRVPTCSSNWCGGSNSAYNTMERRDPLIAGNIASNWGTNNGIITREKDADGVGVLGTPKARNSLHYLIDVGAELSVNKILTKTNSPYIITDTFTVPAGKTLTIKEGVVIKFANNTSALEVAGTLKAEGKSGEEVVFTALADDAYGGDTDNVSAAPAAGAWQHVKILSPAVDTSLDYMRMRYGGKITNGDSSIGRALLRVDAAPVTITNSVFEYSAYYGIRMTGSNSAIATSTLSNMNPASDIEGTHAALFISGGSPSVSGNTFAANKRGIYLAGNTQATVKANTFTNHTDYAISQSSGAAIFIANSGSLNTGNAILLSGNLGIANATTTLSANTLPFALSGAVTVPQNSALAIKKDVVIKGRNNSSLSISGNLLLNGAMSSDIVFEADSTSAPDGYWAGITLETASKATLKGFTLRSAGGSITGGSSNKAGLRAKIPVTIENALIEKNRNVGAWVDGASTIRNTIFRSHTQGTAGAKALFINETSVTLDIITFSGNSTGISATTNATATSTGPVIFEGNTVNTDPANLL